MFNRRNLRNKRFLIKAGILMLFMLLLLALEYTDNLTDVVVFTGDYAHALLFPCAMPLVFYNGTENLEENRKLNRTNLSEQQVEKALSEQGILYGGCWSPKEITLNTLHSYAAVLVPYRDREEHLNIFLLNMHPLFAKQKLSYCIYLIEPVKNITFNRGILFNIGFIESNKDQNNLWQCHVYHDVDLISENEHTSYHCPEYPTHLSYKINKFNYHPIYWAYFGGVSIMRKEHFVMINGYSNLYFGWGGEDDDVRNRIIKAKLKVIKPLRATNVGRYFMLSHEQDSPNPKRHRILKYGRKTSHNEGLNTLDYKIVNVVKTNLYTKIYVYYNQAKILSDFNY